MRKSLFIIPAAALCVAIAGQTAFSNKEDKEVIREFTSVNIQYQGSKVWVPATFIAHKGETLKINLINNAPSGKHGFSLDEYQIRTTVYKGDPKTVEFKADKAGIFRIYCHIHKAHVGGQLLVLEK